MNPTIGALTLLIVLMVAPCGTSAEDHHGDRSSANLGPEVLALLRREMKELNSAVERIGPAIAKADWASIQKIGHEIHASYVLEKSLTAEQRAALDQGLPDEFKQLDARFHIKALGLTDAAEKMDYELASYQYSRLLESCAECHSKYATHRFPGFTSETEPHEHRH